MKFNNSTKIVTLLLALLLAVAVFAACKNDSADPSDSSKTGSDGQSEPAESDTEPEKIKEAIDLIVDGGCNYKLIRPEVSSQELLNYVKALKSEFDKVLDKPIGIAEDWLNPMTGQQPEELEILVGKTNREETAEVLANLKYNDWAIDIVGKKLVITGHNDESIIRAITYFTTNYVMAVKDTKQLTFAPENCITEHAVYPLGSLSLNGVPISKYKIVLPAICSSNETNTTKDFVNFIAKMTGDVITVVKDSTEAGEYEILVGKTNREASAKMIETYRYYDYGFSFGEKTSVVAGYTTTGVVNALNALKTAIDRAATKARDINFTAENNYEFTFGDYLADSVLIGGVPIDKYTIIYPANGATEQALASNLKNIIIENFGYSLPVYSDARAENEYEILIGKTNRAGAAALCATLDVNDASAGILNGNDKYIVINGGANGGLGSAFLKFVDQLVPEQKEKEIKMEIKAPVNTKVSSEPIKVMSYNVLTGAKGSRLNEILTIISDYDPDVIGFQEVQPMTQNELKVALRNKYDFVILPRDNQSYEATPIYYNKLKYNLIDSGAQWLSDTPDRMSRYAESDYNRVYNYVVLEDKVTGARFVHVNTHIDYIAAVNERQVVKLLELTARFSAMPIFYTADWNMYSTEPGYKHMANAGFVDVSTRTEDAHTGPTLIDTEGTIDFVFSSVTMTSVNKYKVIDDHQYSETSSDHYPIYAELNLFY